ncbi:hypothetical protein J6590_041164 [Homalodisca vitripennis]|nr:hypothetical protein J6590_041164 [Homalodisca vitripennis]
MNMEAEDDGCEGREAARMPGVPSAKHRIYPRTPACIVCKSRCQPLYRFAVLALDTRTVGSPVPDIGSRLAHRISNALFAHCDRLANNTGIIETNFTNKAFVKFKNQCSRRSSKGIFTYRLPVDLRLRVPYLGDADGNRTTLPFCRQKA